LGAAAAVIEIGDNLALLILTVLFLLFLAFLCWVYR
jgi:hypothetical protein